LVLDWLVWTNLRRIVFATYKYIREPTLLEYLAPATPRISKTVNFSKATRQKDIDGYQVTQIQD
jgi:hypothetical protein